MPCDHSTGHYVTDRPSRDWQPSLVILIVFAEFGAPKSTSQSLNQRQTVAVIKFETSWALLDLGFLFWSLGVPEFSGER